MNRHFNNIVVLTSKNPEAFLNFTNQSFDYVVVPESNVPEGFIYVNGIDIASYKKELKYALEFNTINHNIASFHIYTEKNISFDATITFKFYTNTPTPGNLEITEEVLIKNRPYIVGKGEITEYSNNDLLIEDEASYMLMRTNPKFTGNVVLNVDNKNNIYLDTIKVSDILSNKKYRKQQVSASSVLSSDIRNVFSTMPEGELYRVDVDNTLSIAIPKTEYKDQYNTTYNYGARLLKDELYSEDNALLAPLWINSKLPDYFAIFRLKGVYNPESYTSTPLDTLVFKYLENSDLIRSWSFKPNTPLGKYLNTHLDDTIHVQAPLFLSLTDPVLKDAESDPNTWYGIAVDKGVLTGRSETPYFFNQHAKNFTDLNAFISGGFERNMLLCPNLLNLQYIFSDEDVSLYTMHRYFGFYLTENVLYKIAYYSNSPSGPIEILSLDGRDISDFISSSIFDAQGNIINDYKNRIFALNDEIQLQRVKNVNQINGTKELPYVSKPHKNLFSAEVEKTNIQPFITLTLNNTFTQGEHLRLINKTQNKIWEVYSVDIREFDCKRYCTISENDGYPTVYRTYFDINGDISYQIKEICEAFDRFSDYEGTYFRCGVRGNNWISIILNDDANTDDEWSFQRILAPTLNEFSDPSSGYNDAAKPEDITFFGIFTPTEDDTIIVEYNDQYGPIDFELYGDRQSIIVDLIDRKTNNLYSFTPIDNILDKFENPTLYQGTDLWYRRLLEFDVYGSSYMYVKDPLSIKNNVLIMTEYDVNTVKNKINAYSIYPLNISLMGINPVKDIDYIVYDQSLGYGSEYNYKRDDDKDTFKVDIKADETYNLNIPGSYIVSAGTGTLYQEGVPNRTYEPLTLFNTFDSSISITTITPTTVTYAILDGNYEYKALKNGVEGNVENINDYYESNSLLKYGLTVPFSSKWVGLGNDCRNNPSLLMLNSDILDVSTNFIPDENNFTQEISYPSFKYLSTKGRAWQDYIFYDINDVVSEDEELTFKDAMFKYPHVDYFSKLVYSNYGVDSTFTRSSIVYYNQYKNTIDVIFMGLNFSIKAENIARNVIDIKNYDRFRFSFISTPSRNKDNNRPIEVIINENTKTILMIWYQGNDELNYNMRYSSYLPGKALLDPSDYGFVTGEFEKNYSFVKTPYFVRNDTISKTVEKFYSSDVTYDSGTAQPYAQFNKGLFSSIWNAFGNNSITGSSFNVETNKHYETFAQYVSYTYMQNSNTYGDYVQNYGYNYDNNTNWYTNNTCNLNTLRYLLSTSFNYVMYYVIRGNAVYNSFNFGGTINPITIAINSPRTYMKMKTYNGWFKPKFNSILEFKMNEEPELVNILNQDFIFSNTNLRSYKSIPQLWYNKLTDNVDQMDISVGNAISFINNYNVFKSQWDANYYIKDNNNYINGYESFDELPSFFGSKLPKFPDEVLLNDWDITTASYTQTDDEIVLSYNLTRAVLNKFKKNSTFLLNWSNFSNTDNIIDGYVKNTVLTYYNISQSKILLNYYYAPYNKTLLHYTLDNNAFINDNKQNFNGQLAYVNDEYIYNITIPRIGNFSYFVSFTLTEK